MARLANTLCILTITVVSCGPRPAPRAAGEPEPSAPHATANEVATVPPSPAPAPSVGDQDVDPATIEKLGGCWFESPYDYMFGGGPSVQVGAGTYGQFTGGISGILYYGDLNECVAEHVGTQTASYSDNAPFAELAGVPLYSDLMDDSKPFGFFNPDLVRWGHENLIPPATATVAGVAVTTIYSVVFSRFFRLITESYLWLVQSGNWRKEQDEYWKMAQKKNVWGVEWLQKRYAGALKPYDIGWDGTCMTPQMAIGFWLRRSLDGTSDELWTGLKKVMTRFDADWYKGLRNSYPSPDITW